MPKIDKNKVVDYIGTLSEFQALPSYGYGVGSSFTIVDGNGKIIDYYEWDGTRWNN